MYAVFRETHYESGREAVATPQYQEFNAVHAKQPGYCATIVAEVSAGRLLTVTLWATEESMVAARQSLGPVVARTLNPMMTAPAVLLGTGPVVLNDLTASE
jgi:hypothetical protein